MLYCITPVLDTVCESGILREVCDFQSNLNSTLKRNDNVCSREKNKEKKRVAYWLGKLHITLCYLLRQETDENELVSAMIFSLQLLPYCDLSKTIHPNLIN